MKAKDIRKGKIILYKGAPHVVLEFQHRTPGNLRAFVQAKLRNIATGIQTETKFSSTDELEVADVYTFKATYLYKDGAGYHFMNSDNYEEVQLSEEIVGSSASFIQDGMTVEISTYESQPIGVTLPKTVVLTIVDTTPDLKGATASNSPKPATTDTGLVVSVPPFIKVGEKIVVDTEEGTYLSRAEA